MDCIVLPYGQKISDILKNLLSKLELEDGNIEKQIDQFVKL